MIPAKIDAARTLVGCPSEGRIYTIHADFRVKGLKEPLTLETSDHVTLEFGDTPIPADFLLGFHCDQVR